MEVMFPLHSFSLCKEERDFFPFVLIGFYVTFSLLKLLGGEYTSGDVSSQFHIDLLIWYYAPAMLTGEQIFASPSIHENDDLPPSFCNLDYLRLIIW